MKTSFKKLALGMMLAGLLLGAGIAQAAVVDPNAALILNQTSGDVAPDAVFNDTLHVQNGDGQPDTNPSSQQIQLINGGQDNLDGDGNILPVSQASPNSFVP